MQKDERSEPNIILFPGNRRVPRRPNARNSVFSPIDPHGDGDAVSIRQNLASFTPRLTSGLRGKPGVVLGLALIAMACAAVLKAA